MSADESFEHDPVMVREITDLFAAVPAGTVVDATLGGGGHSASLLRSPRRHRHPRHRPGRRGARPPPRHVSPNSTSGCAPAAAGSTSSTRPWTTTASSRSAGRCSTSACRRPSSTVPSVASRTATTGRSTCAWTATQPWSAADVVNGYAEHELARIIRRYGDERFASRIARGDRRGAPLQSTTDTRRGDHRRDPGRRPSHRGTSRQAHVPGDPDRSQRRTRRPPRRPRPGGRGDRVPAGASPCSRTTRARTAS